MKIAARVIIVIIFYIPFCLTELGLFFIDSLGEKK